MLGVGQQGACRGLAHVGCRHLCSPSKQGTPELLRTSDCDFVFEWETPLVCPDEVKVDGCSLMDEQLYYSFNLSSLSKSTFKVAPARARGGGRGGAGRAPEFFLMSVVFQVM